MSATVMLRKLRAPFLLPSIPALVAGLALFAVGGAFAQDSRHTGRHHPRTPAPAPAQKEKLASPARPAEFRWCLAFRLGTLEGGDLFEARTNNGISVPWIGVDPGGFKSSHFKTNFENNLAFGLTFGRSLSPVWRLTGDLTYAKVDVAANALIGQGGGRFRYDRFGILSAGLGLQRDLVEQASAPYALLALTLVKVSPDVNDGLGQTSLGGRMGLGFRQRVDQGSFLFLEGRLELTGLDNMDFVPEAQSGFNPPVSVEFRDRLTLFSLLGGVEFRW